MNNTIIRKIIESDCSKKSLQAIVIVGQENDISLSLIQEDKEQPAIYNISYSQLCSLSQLINNAIDVHYQSYSKPTKEEKKSTIYINDPVDW